MSIQDIEAVIGQIEQWKSQESQYGQSMTINRVQSTTSDHNLRDCEYEMIKAKIFDRVLPLFKMIKDQLEECRRRESESHQSIEELKQELQLRKYENIKLQQKIKFYQQVQQDLNNQIDSLGLSMIEKTKQSQTKEENAEFRIDQLTKNNHILNQALEMTYLKCKNLEIIIQAQQNGKQRLQAQLSECRREEKRWIVKIQRMKSSIQAQKLRVSKIQAELEQKTKQLQQWSLKMDMDGLNEKSAFTKAEDRMKSSGRQWQGVASDEITVSNLSQHISIDEKQYIFMNQPAQSSNIWSSNEWQRAHHFNFSNQPMSIYPQTSNQSQQNSSQIKHQPKRLSICTSFAIHCQQSQPNQPQTTISQPSSHDEIRNSPELLIAINDRADIRLKSCYNSANQIMVDTLASQRQTQSQISIINAELKDDKKCLPENYAVDPYFIHYTLMVQSIKIEEDEQGLYGILDIDMRDFYDQLLRARVSVCRWGEWIREKLLEIYNKNV